MAVEQEVLGGVGVGEEKEEETEKGHPGFSMEGLFEYINENIVSLLEKKAESLPRGRKKSVFVTTRIRAPSGSRVRLRSEVELQSSGKKKRSGQDEGSTSVNSFKEWMGFEKEKRLKTFKRAVNRMYEGKVESEGEGEGEGEGKKMLPGVGEIEIYLEEEDTDPEEHETSVEEKEEKGEDGDGDVEDFDDDELIDALFGSESDQDEDSSFEFQINKLNDDEETPLFKNPNPERKKSGNKRVSKRRGSNKRVSKKRGDQRNSKKRLSRQRGRSDAPKVVPQVKFRPIEAVPKAKRSFDLRKRGPSPGVKEAKKRISKHRGLDDQLRRVAQDAGAVYPSSGAPKMGAGIKRKFRINNEEKKKKKRPHRVNLNQVRTKNMGPNLQPQFIFLYFFIPLVILALESLLQYLDLAGSYLNPDGPTIEIEHDEEAIPYIIRFIINKLFQKYPQVLNNGLRIGATVVRIGGLYVLYTAFMRYFNLFKALRPKPIVRLKTEIRNEEEDKSYMFRWMKDEYTDSSDSE